MPLTLRFKPVGDIALLMSHWSIPVYDILFKNSSMNLSSEMHSFHPLFGSQFNRSTITYILVLRRETVYINPVFSHKFELTKS